MNTPDFTAAAGFVAASARVLDQRRFQRLVEDGPAAPVRDAVAAYRNEDGGFGHALEPDCRAPGSQPPAAAMALRIMDETARALFDDATVQAHLDHLAQGQKDDGGWTFNWPAWSPAAERDWRGFLTVDALRLLRANGRRLP